MGTRRDGKVKTPTASPFKPIENINILTNFSKIQLSAERNISTPTPSSTSADQKYDGPMLRRLSSDSILASPTKSALKKSNDRSSSPSRLAGKKIGLESSARVESREINTVPLSLPTGGKAQSPSRNRFVRPISPNRDLRHTVRSSLIISPQVSPLKLKVRSKPSSSLFLHPNDVIGNRSISPGKLSPPRRRGPSVDETLEHVPEHSLSYVRSPVHERELDFEWNHISKCFVMSPQKGLD